MNRSTTRSLSNTTPALSIHRPDVEERNTATWRINGYPARIIIWTSEEWERLENRPTDAQYYPCGVWCALRLD